MSSLQHDSTADQSGIIPFAWIDSEPNADDASDDGPRPDDRDLFDLPSAADERWNAETSPLNRSMYFVDGEMTPYDLVLLTSSPSEYYEPTEEDWEEYEVAFARIDARTREYRSREFYP